MLTYTKIPSHVHRYNYIAVEAHSIRHRLITSLSFIQQHRQVAQSIPISLRVSVLQEAFIAFRPEKETLTRLKMSEHSMTSAYSSSHDELEDRSSADFLSALLPELVLGVASFCPKSALLALSYCNRHFRYDFTTAAGAAFRESASMEKMRHSKQRFAFLCAMERDDLLAPTRATCSACKRTHDNCLFTDRALAADATTRRCRGADGRLWICPHRTLDFAQARFLSNIQRVALSPFETLFCPEASLPPPCAGRLERTIYEKTTISQEIYICETSWGKSIDLKEAVVCLERLNLHTCPHIRLGDPALVQHLESVLGERQSPRPVRMQKCGLCGTQVTFEVKSYSNEDYFCPPHVVKGRCILRAMVHRENRHFRDPADSAWLAVMSLPAEVAMRDDEWRAAGLECATDSQLGSCLLPRRKITPRYGTSRGRLGVRSFQ